jgi:hypothetical protein
MTQAMRHGAAMAGWLSVSIVVVGLLAVWGLQVASPAESIQLARRASVLANLVLSPAWLPTASACWLLLAIGVQAKTRPSRKPVVLCAAACLGIGLLVLSVWAIHSPLISHTAIEAPH